jgi:hypothetical protein
MKRKNHGNSPNGAAPADELTGKTDHVADRLRNIMQDDAKQPSEEQSSWRKLQGASLLDFSKLTINEKNTLLGNRFLCRDGGMFIVAPSGIGKSVLAVQIAILLACGLMAFGINPSGALKILIIQAEDDEGDIIEMSRMVNHLELTEQQKQLVDINTHVEFVNDVTAKDFLKDLDAFLAQYKPDLIIINPYTAYLGADNKDDEKNTAFLRNGLNPLLTKHHCAVIIIHHTPKTNFRANTEKWKVHDWAYSGAGAAVLTNWARAYIAIEPCEEHGVYRFIAAKRGKRIGWRDEDGYPVYEQFWAHNTEEGPLLWIPATEDQIDAANAKGQKQPYDLLPLIPFDEPIIQKRLFSEAKRTLGGMGQKKVRDFVKFLIEEKAVQEEKIPQPGTRAAIGYIRRHNVASAAALGLPAVADQF